MPASAARARASTQRASRRRPATRRTAAPRARARGRTPVRGFAAPAHLIPAAVGKTAVAVGDLADSGLVVRMTRSRTWIGVLCVLLAGIVALNVLSLSLTASSGRVAARADALRQENAVLRSQLTERLSSQRVKDVAAGLGLSVPNPQDITYLRAGDEYAAAAAQRIEQGAVTPSSDAAAATEAYVPVAEPAPVP